MNASTARSLEGCRLLITGIADEGSLALPIAREAQDAGAEILCAGLGPTRHHTTLSPTARRYLEGAQQSFEKAVVEALGDVPRFVLDASLDESVEDLARELAGRGIQLDGLVHAIAFDRTIRAGEAKPLLATTRSEFLDCMAVSAYSLIALLRALLEAGVLTRGGAAVTLSYAGAERVMPHPYRNIGVAKAALERIVRELAAELGRSHGLRVNAVRFSPWTRSRAGGAIPGLADAMALWARCAPLGNASALCLAREVVHLLRPGTAITGDVRHVDGGAHVFG